MIKAPLIVIVGPTGSGKSSVALDMAKKYNGEIICADSRTVYRGMDIGTAKPSRTDQQEIPHHLLDIIGPNEVFTAARFKESALKAIKKIEANGRIPFLVGGTGLYIDGVIFDFAFQPPVAQEERDMLNGLTIEELKVRLREQDIPMPQNSQNKRHLVRALETNGSVPIKKGLRQDTLVIGIDIEKAELEVRVRLRIAKMMQDGLSQEVESLAGRYGWEAPGLTGVGYREWQDYFAGSQNLADTLRQIEQNTMQYAKRQRTWFKRNTHIKWVKNSAEADSLINKFLQKS